MKIPVILQIFPRKIFHGLRNTSVAQTVHTVHEIERGCRRVQFRPAVKSSDWAGKFWNPKLISRQQKDVTTLNGSAMTGKLVLTEGF